jgi:arabinofuranosyltransferase
MRVARIVALVLITWAVVRVAWVSDDALITLRHALNISHGWGAGFNSTESVQAYSHPLWFLLWMVVGVPTSEWVVGVIALGLVSTLIATAILIIRIQSLAVLVIVLATLLLSNAFVEYATSGLENPLGYLSMAVLIALTLSLAQQAPKSSPSLPMWMLTGVTAAAAVLTRMDFAVMVALPLLALAWSHRRDFWRLSVLAVSALVPVGVWLLWTFITYRAWLPNTYLAKTNVEIPRLDLIGQGLTYIWISVRHDPITGVGIAIGLLMAFWVGNTMVRAWALGVVAYLGYVVWIGGDFMAGRFLAVPLFVAVFLGSVAWTQSRSDNPPRATRASAVVAAVGAVAVVALVGLTAIGLPPTVVANPQEQRWVSEENGRITDERGFYLFEADRSLANLLSDEPFALEGYIAPVGAEFAKSGLKDIDQLASEWPTSSGYSPVPTDAAVTCGLMGSWGIVTGPTVHLIDVCGLADRFMAEKPFVANGPWLPGHFARDLPAGYEEAIRLADPSLVTDPQEAERLRQVWGLIRPDTVSSVAN